MMGIENRIGPTDSDAYGRLWTLNDRIFFKLFFDIADRV
jgi:hypothetical protein